MDRELVDSSGNQDAARIATNAPLPAFKLAKYFSLLSMILLLIFGGFLATFLRNSAIDEMKRQAEERNASMTQLLGNLLLQDIESLLAGAVGKTKDELHALASVQQLNTRISAIVRGSEIVKVKIYDPQGLTIFSTELAQIGEDKRDNPGFNAARTGSIYSELVHREKFSATEGLIVNVDLVSSYIPFVRDGEVFAVFEQYQHVDKLLQQVENSVIKKVTVIVLVFLILYILLFWVVRHAEGIVKVQEARLESANRDLDRRVDERTKALQESEARFRSLTEMSSDFYWETDVNHRFTLRSCSRREAEDPIFLQNTFIGQLRWEVPHVSPDEAGWRAHRDMLEAHLPFRDFEISRYGINDNVLIVSVSGDPLFDADGRFRGYRGVGRDITDQKQSELRLKLYADLFEQSNEAMLITDRDNNIILTNAALTRITGYSAEELLGCNPRILSSGQTSAEVYDEMWAALSSHGYWSGEVLDRRKNGVVYPKWLTISELRDTNGAVTHYIGLFIDITERKQTEELIEHLAHHDNLTKLFNRHSLQERLGQALATAQRKHAPLAVMFIDIDRFKRVNDTLGHHVGDLLLIDVAERLRHCVRESDIVARLGGDEFVVVLTGMEDVRDAFPVGSKILHELGHPYHLASQVLQITPSIGISIYPDDGSSVDDLMKNADMAMYHAKSQGRNNLQFFTAAMNAAATERMEMEIELRQAIETGQLELHYQPQICAHNGTACGVEALVRWRHPQRGLISPLSFIPLAEETGLIDPLGAWVLEEACRQFAIWRAADAPVLRIAVNLSAHQLRSPGLVAQVEAVMTRYEMIPGELELEVTESVAMSDPEHSFETLRALRNLGVQLAIDDFGTGYSSLSYLKHLPVQILKIDRSFVQDIESDENDASICASILALAHSQGLKVVAEGVETAAQREFLSVHACEYLQGYLFGKPEPPEVCLGRLRELSSAAASS
ncbi:putative bifunctional diguanylate cyclase/phosphodiesterase [Paramagnetospirillum marisnigri]|nr:EAL domain-containing protein [Paramagnetospirillum marisnigri]